jgi:hypothetical protein
MPFPQHIREQALVAAARHCCVCNRYKGVKVEVHHIVPQSEGGPNELENAITLCFDCHADAGHYNPRHPRGTKFSPTELRRHRDQWHAKVQSHGVLAPDIPDALYCRFLLCKSFDSFREICTGELTNAPVSQPYLINNSVRVFQNQVVNIHPHPYRHDHVWGTSFPNKEAYARAHPRVPLQDRSSIDGHPYFEATRIPSLDELREALAPQDGVTKLLVGAGVAPQEISIVFAYYEECGVNRFQEIYRLRPIWSVYLAVTNLLPDQVILTQVSGTKTVPSGLGYRPFEGTSQIDDQTTEPLPAAPLLQGATILLPVATILGPIANVSIETMYADTSHLSTGQCQIESVYDWKVLGDGILPASFCAV